MKDKQRWQAKEDALLCTYVKQYGPREWNLVSQRMNAPLNRDANSCLERWKNYLKPGIKKGSLTAEEQRLVIHLQAKHGNKWKKIAAEVPGRTAKRLGKWWEVFKEKQQGETKATNRIIDPIYDSKYEHILESFVEKLVNKRHPSPSYVMASSNGSFLHTDPALTSPAMLPSWLSISNSNNTAPVRPPSPSVTLSLSPSVVTARPPWMQTVRVLDNSPRVLGNATPHRSVLAYSDKMIVSELVQCSKELEEVHYALAAHKKEASWRLSRVELQLESEKASRRREKMEEVKAKIKALRDEQAAAFDRIEAEYRDELVVLRRDAEAKEQKLTEQWAAKHLRLTKFLEKVGCRSRIAETNAR